MRESPDRDQIAKILCQFQSNPDSGLNANQACRKAGIGITTY